MTDLRLLPKVELHLHLDCCLSYDLIRRLDPSVTPERFRQDFVAPPKCRDLAEYLRTPPNHVALLQTEEALRLAVADLFAQLAADNVIYAEIRFAPLLHTRRGLSTQQVVAAVAGAVARNSTATGIGARVILCTLRHFTEAESLETVRLAAAFRDTHVAAFDIAGDEAGYPLAAHLAAFEFAAREGIPYTVHGGEARGPESMWELIRHFRPARFGHGVRSIEDPALVAHLREAGIHLEVCPSCNVQIGIAPDYAGHPVDRLYRAGVSLGINTDTRTISDITLTQEYERLAATFGWTAVDFRQANLNAARAAFLSDIDRDRLARRLLVGYAEVTTAE